MFNEAMLEAGEYRLPLKLAQETRPSAKVAIFLATYNGEKYLEDQLQSILAQRHDNWLVVASDDGSQDGTLELLQRYRQQLGPERIRLLQGPGRGFADNFLELACNKSITADYFAFCDQDDIWHADHLQRALNWLRSIDPSRPALHCGRTRLVSANGGVIGTSPLFPRPPAFGNALVQSLAGGNTMVFNATARGLLMHAGRLPIVSHDWWAYMLISGAGGQVAYTEAPSVDYRQHGANLIGANSSAKARLHRIRRMLAGHFQDWNDINIASLQHCQALLTEANRKTLASFAQARRATLLERVRAIHGSGVYRQTTPGNLALALATLLGKI